jgi:hypothetical protein
MRAAAVTPIAVKTAFCFWLVSGGLGAEPVGPDEITVVQAARGCAAL